MKKLIAILFASILLINAQILFAADSAYKNNLLKVEVVKVDENDYDIGLYTQKIYNEPVKVVKKSDTLYYVLLPETSHAVTSVPTTGVVKNVTVKSYPYAGQDMKNGYTKVAIITSKPINISTSLRTLDTSISPRLDPLRLARLDKAFERYSDRLAQNNVPTPLSEFRDKKQTIAQVPVKKPVTVQQPPVKKPVVAQPVKKPVVVEQPKKQVSEPVKIAQAKPSIKPSILPKKVEKQIQPETKPVQKPQEEPKKEQIMEQKPTEAEFTEILPQEQETETEKDLEQKEIQPVKEKDIEILPVEPPVEQGNKINIPLPLLAGIFVILLCAYIFIKKSNKKNAVNNEKETDVQNTAGIKELLKNRSAANTAINEQQEEKITSFVENTITDTNEKEEETVDFKNILTEETAAPQPKTTETAEIKPDIEKIEEEDKKEEIDDMEDFFHTEDDEVIRQLYTPIETPVNSVYSTVQNTPPSDSDEATVISSCKLTETRGLYLVKYDNALALIGYIQDDIYVLHNFENDKLADTKINASLAMENDADIIYVVTIADRKFMVKSAPFTMSLEAVI